MTKPLTVRRALIAVPVMTTLALVNCSDRSMSNPAPDKIDQLFAKWNKPDSPGCSLGISRNGQLVYERGYGMANLELNAPITPESVFEAASISKQFTAMSIMLLVERGRLSLDDEVRKYLPEMPVYGAPLRIRHLLNHTSGLRDAFLILELSAPEDEYGDRNDVILKQLARQRSSNYPPGTESQYNNGGYVLAAIIVKRVSGQPLAAFARANIFTPLGMANTRFQDDPAVIIPNRASNYYSDAGTWRFVPSGTQPGAVGNSGLWTTTGDLLRWANNLADPRVGSSRLLADMQTPQPPASPEPPQWGLGFAIGEHRGATFVGHGGGDRGIDTNFAWYPKQRLAIAVLCNTDNIGSLQLTQRIADLYLPAAPAEPAAASASLAPPLSPPSSRPAIQPSSEELEGKAGLYREAGGETFVRAFVRDGELRAALGTGTFESFRLVPVSETRFTMGESTFALEFTPQGRAKVLRSFAGEEQTGTFERVEPFSPSPGQLRAYAGVYASDELNAEWTIAGHGATLVIRRLGNADTVIEPLATDMFTTVGDFMKFSRDARGTITGFTLVSSGVRSLRFERVNRSLGLVSKPPSSG
jgi:CubicO group peptidase (beta-lactamase class C family)